MPRESETLVGLSVHNNQFTIEEYVTGGSFGSFHFGTETRTGKRVGIKLEKKDCQQAQLFLEYGFYRALGSVRFIPKIFHFGPINDWNVLVMEVLGPSLGNMNAKCGYRFSIQTTTQLMVQMITIFEYIHEHGIIYRDIKPENFLIGPANTEKWCTVMLIDLGFCKKYVDEENRHIEYKTGKPITGTVRYISVNNHAGRELSRRDDLEALLYMMVFLQKGQLPWQGITNSDVHERYKAIGLKKHLGKARELCEGMPPQYANFLSTVKHLAFEERPAYEDMRADFYEALFKMGATMDMMNYDWNEAHMPVNEVVTTATSVVTGQQQQE